MLAEAAGCAPAELVYDSPAKSHWELVLPGSGSGHDSVPQQSAGGGKGCWPPFPPRVGIFVLNYR